MTANAITSALEGLAIGAWVQAHGAGEVDVARSDEQLMLAYRNGDRDAFRHLYERHRDRLYRFILRVAAGAVEADEIFQEVWTAVIRGRERYVPDAKFSTYLFAIAHRRAIDRLRAKWRADERIEREANENDIAEGQDLEPLQIAMHASAAAALLAAIDALPLPQREALLLQIEGDLTLEDIATATATNRETVKSRLRYAHRRLRAALQEWR